MARDQLNPTLQENILTILAYDDDLGKSISQFVKADLFEGDYRLLAERILDFWRDQKQAPKVHTPDLIDDILSDKANRRARHFSRILDAMDELRREINSKYVIDQLQTFVRLQQMKAAIYESAEALQNRQELAIEEVESLWQKLLSAQNVTHDSGLSMHAVDNVISFIEQRANEFVTGIPILDKRQATPVRGGTVLFLAPPKRGKSWFLITCGRHAMMLRKRVLHISLEMPAEEVLMRYYQALFSVAKYDEPVKTTVLDIEEHESRDPRRARLIGFETDMVDPSFAMTSPYLRDELISHVSTLGNKSDYLRIKRFPTRGVSIAEIEAYIDLLEAVDGFIPDMIVLDYIGITKVDPKNYRIALGRAFEDFRGMCVRRNVAGVTAAQTTRDSVVIGVNDETKVAEDWSMIATADTVISYSQTKAEKRYGLARLHVPVARGDQDGFGVLISQAYAIGQFALSSVLLPMRYKDLLADFAGPDDDEAGDGERSDDDDATSSDDDEE